MSRKFQMMSRFLQRNRLWKQSWFWRRVRKPCLTSKFLDWVEKVKVSHFLETLSLSCHWFTHWNSYVLCCDYLSEVYCSAIHPSGVCFATTGVGGGISLYSTTPFGEPIKYLSPASKGSKEAPFGMKVVFVSGKTVPRSLLNLWRMLNVYVSFSLLLPSITFCSHKTESRWEFSCFWN